MDETGSIGTTAPSGPLALWLALELRRARAAFDRSRKEQDAEFEAWGVRKTGVRVKRTLKSASEICVALADATIAKAAECHSPLAEFQDAGTRVQAFTKEVTTSAIPLAFFVSGETGLGGSVVKAATERGRQLCADIEGAFRLAVQAPQSNAADALERLFAHWRREAVLDYATDRDAVSGEFGLAGRLQSGSHIRKLSDAAERRVFEMLGRARALPIMPESYATALSASLALLDELGTDVRIVAIGASGRMPTPANGSVADGFIGQARERIERQVDKWSLEDCLRAVPTSRHSLPPPDSIPTKYVKLSHARDHLRQHLAIDAGLDPMDNRPLGSDPKSIDFETIDICREQMARCRATAHWEIAGLISGVKIAVWKERQDGGMEPAGAQWARNTFDAPGTASNELYFARDLWEQQLTTLASAESRAYFLGQETNIVGAVAIQSFDDAERKHWMLSLEMMPADKAHKLFKAHPRYDGTKQKEFRLEWKTVRGTKQGRQAKSKS